MISTVYLPMAEAAENMKNTHIQVTQHSERGAQERCWVHKGIDDSSLLPESLFLSWHFALY